MIAPPAIAETLAQASASIRITVPRDRIREVMGPAIHEVLDTLARQGLAPAGPVYSLHFRVDPAVFDFEVGVPVAAPFQPVGRVVASGLPAARIARTVYRGPYEQLGAAWGAFKGWIAGQGLTAGPGMWERYVRGPESTADPAGWETELCCPLV